MIQDITSPQDARDLIKFTRGDGTEIDRSSLHPRCKCEMVLVEEHTDSPDCPECRKPDLMGNSIRAMQWRMNNLAREIERKQTACAHDHIEVFKVHPVVEDENGLVLEQESVQQCTDCRRVLWERM